MSLRFFADPCTTILQQRHFHDDVPYLRLGPSLNLNLNLNLHLRLYMSPHLRL